MTDSRPTGRGRELLFFLVFALAISLVNIRYVDLMQGTAASEWMTAINILESPQDFPNSLQYGFFHGINTFSEHAGVVLNRDYGIPVTTLDKAQVFAQDFFIVFGIWLICVSLGRGAFTASVSILLVFASCFTLLGRYLNLQVTYIPTHSAVAFAFGLFILGLFANGKRALPIILCCLLFIWHPSHSFILHSFMWVFIILNFKREGGLKSVAAYAAIDALFLAPVFYASLPQFGSLSAPMTPERISLWWALLEARTTNIFPLNDGAISVINTWLSLAAGYMMLPFVTSSRPGCNSPQIRRAVRFAWFVLVWIAVLWFAQIAAAHFLHIIPITRLALTRCTPYAVVYICIFASAAVENMWKNGSRAPAIAFPAASALLGFLVRLHVPLLAAFLAYIATANKCDRSARLLRAAGVSAFFALAASGVLIHALDTFNLFHAGMYDILRKLCAVFLYASMLAALGVLAAVAFKHLRRAHNTEVTNSVPPSIGAAAAIAVATVIALSANIALLAGGSKYDLRYIDIALRESNRERLELQRWAETSTPRGSLFVMNPLLFAGFEQTAHRPGFIAKEEIHYPIYALGLLDEVVTRLKIMGVDVNDKEFTRMCGLSSSLKAPRCRQMLLYEKIDADFPSAVMSNTGELLSKYGNARYLIVEKGKSVPAPFAASHPAVYKNEMFSVYDLRNQRR